MPTKTISKKPTLVLPRPCLIFLVYALFPLLSYSQLTLTNLGGSYTDLAQSLSHDPNVVISNATGQRIIPSQMAYFTNPGGNNLQISSGIVFSTGNISNCNSSKNLSDYCSSANSDYQMIPGDPQLQSVSTSTARIYDWAILEFDLMITSGSGLQFNYVFGSDEYPEYVCARYDDAFGLWIQGGTQYPSYTNIALTPNGNQQISINTVNNGVIGSYGSLCPPKWNLNSSYFIDNFNGEDIEADGLTTRLTSNLTLTPNVPYKFKIAISDINDPYQDSWVFIEANFATLPVNLISFTGNYQFNNYNRLTWNVANESDFSHYVVQRSKDPLQGFMDVKSVYGAGTPNYNCLDYSEGEDYYYRLMMVDLDGTTTFSDLIHISGEKNSSYIQIKNTDNDIYLMHESASEQNGKLYIYNSSGQEIYNREVIFKAGVNEIKLERLKPGTGVFFASLITDHSIFKTRFVR